MMLFFNDAFNNIAQQLDKILKDVETYRSVYRLAKDRAEDEINAYSRYKERAMLGDKAARDYIINQYVKLMSSKLINITEEKIKSMIDFDDLQNNPVQVLFEMLLDIADISMLLDKYNLSIRVSEKYIRQIVDCESVKIKNNFAGYHSRLRLISILAFAGEYGQDCIDTLQYHNINEIGIIDSDYIYIVHGGNKIFLDFLKFKDRNVILNIQKKTTQNSSVNYDEQNPSVVAAKNNSSRITVAGYGLTPSDEELYYNERLFKLKKVTLEELRDEYRTLDDLTYDLLLLNQKGRGSHFITGADMGVGKSTFMLAMMEKIPDQWGIGILDTQNELQARKKYPWKNIKTLIQTPKRTISECFALQLKMARDVLYVGEITMPAEAAELINACLRLNAGVGATMHSLSPFEVVTNLRNLMMRTEMYNDTEIAEADIARALDLVIHLARHPKEKKRIVVDRVVEIQYCGIDQQIRLVLEGSTDDKISNLINMAQMALYRYLFPGSYSYNTVIRFDYNSDTWIPENLPSDYYFNKISRYVSEEEINNFKIIFQQRKRLKL